MTTPSITSKEGFKNGRGQISVHGIKPIQEGVRQEGPDATIIRSWSIRLCEYAGTRCPPIV